MVFGFQSWFYHYLLPSIGRKMFCIARSLSRSSEKYLQITYSTLGGKTGKLDEAVNKELNVTRS